MLYLPSIYFKTESCAGINITNKPRYPSVSAKLAANLHKFRCFGNGIDCSLTACTQTNTHGQEHPTQTTQATRIGTSIDIATAVSAPNEAAIAARRLSVVSRTDGS